MAKPIFNYSKYPEVFTCQALDRQISGLRDELGQIDQKKMTGNKNDVRRLKNEKELQFAQQDCGDFLQNLEIREGQELIKNRFIKAEKDIINKSNQRRLVLLLSGAGVLVIGLAVILYVRYGKK